MTVKEAIETLSYMRCEYNCFDEGRRRYHALSMAIEALENNDKLAEDLQNCLEMYKKKKAEVEALKQPQIIRCKDCKHRVVNEHYGENGYFKLKAYCDLDTGDIFELGRCAEEDDWFCADAERREEE